MFVSGLTVARADGRRDSGMECWSLSPESLNPYSLKRMGFHFHGGFEAVNLKSHACEMALQTAGGSEQGCWHGP